MESDAPLSYEHLVDEASNEGYEMAEYIAFLNEVNADGFYEGTIELYKWAYPTPLYCGFFI